jgi:hypothetical protein
LASPLRSTLFTWWKRLRGPHRPLSPVQQRAHELIEAIDAGGLPLNPARVNDIARKLGLAVSSSAPMAETIERIRRELAQLP